MLAWLTRRAISSASEQAQRLRDAQETAGASTAAATRALKMAQEAREVACATLSELGAQADALRSAAASLGEAEAAVHASERTLDDINAGCFGCFAPRRRLARRQLAPGGGVGTWRHWWSPGGGAAERREAPAPAEVSPSASQRLRKPASAKSAAARARLASSQPLRAVAGGTAGGYAQAGGSKGGGGGAFGDALLDKEASAQDAALSQLDAAVRCTAALRRQAC